MDSSFCDQSPALKRCRTDEMTDSPCVTAKRLTTSSSKQKLSFDFSPAFGHMFRQASTPTSVIEDDDEDTCDSGFSEASHLVSTACNDSYEIFQSFTDKVSIQYQQQQQSPFGRSSKSSADLLLGKTVRKMSQRAKSASMIARDSDFNGAAIKKALENVDELKEHRLVGDMSTHHALPVLQKSKHKDLASISPDTLVDLINGKYSDQIEEYIIFDARFPYEFQGGHIAGAENVFRKEDSFDRLFKQPIQPTSASGKRVVIIFHCEFSSERGPRLMREVRERDRILNAEHYPKLHYPEMYLLEGGYKNFYLSFNAEHCEPRAYLPMDHDNHRNDLKFFRQKSKTWGPDSGRVPLSLQQQSANRTPSNRCGTKSRLNF